MVQGTPCQVIMITYFEGVILDAHPFTGVQSLLNYLLHLMLCVQFHDDLLNLSVGIN